MKIHSKCNKSAIGGFIYIFLKGGKTDGKPDKNDTRHYENEGWPDGQAGGSYAESD